MIEKQVWINLELDDLDFEDICYWIDSYATDTQLDELREILQLLGTPREIKDLARTLQYRGEEEFITQFKEYINQNTELHLI